MKFILQHNVIDNLIEEIVICSGVGPICVALSLFCSSVAAITSIIHGKEADSLQIYVYFSAGKLVMEPDNLVTD